MDLVSTIVSIVTIVIALLYFPLFLNLFLLPFFVFQAILGATGGVISLSITPLAMLYFVGSARNCRIVYWFVVDSN